MQITKLYRTLNDPKSKFVVTKTTKGIIMASTVSGKTVSVRIVPNGKKGQFEIKPANYAFRSHNAFFDYGQVENRYCRDQNFLNSLFRELERKDVGQYIANLSTYIQPNQHNEKSNKSIVKERLKQMVPTGSDQ